MNSMKMEVRGENPSQFRIFANKRRVKRSANWLVKKADIDERVGENDGSVFAVPQREKKGEKI